ncbi:DUF72 domain-containing protein [Paraburkholderia sprentiae WSM5005]|uniref:DUF72 domain-containing protein n=1 Tax=Paraburkholderia sprentiae WSM5005 TaxID=754502 RepID=A0A1I9YN42_9BURK|nr:DUF72 domain-containing protein [Paraburkholderia sprentiae]APA87725.1 DUF72 domain-containing protein [Paraburkholderia sprentiae WSM5005]
MIDAPHRENPPTASPIHIGCAGWALSAKVAARFPAQGSHLERYAQVFPTVEINSSFYRSHQPKTYARWAASVPDAFRFSVKVPRRISHELRLRDADAAVSEFVQELAPLGEKLGCLLLQLPPSLALDEVATGDFFSLLRGRTAAHVVCEPRHASWFTEEGARTLKNAGIACVRAHPSPVAGVEPMGDPGTLYIRLHGSPEIYYSAYDETFIEAVAARIIDARNSATEVWCIFDNTARGEAVPNALTLMEKLEKAAC